MSITLGLDQASIQQQIQAGTADLALGNEPVPASALATLSRDNDPGLHLNPTGGQNPYVAINLVGPNPALKKVEVRRALNYAVNKRNVVQVVGGSKVARATGQIFTESVVGPGFTVQDQYRTPDSAGDPAKAKQLLAQAGYPDGLTLVLAYRSSGNGPRIAETLVADLKASGITLTPKEIPSRDYYPRFMQKTAIAKQGGWDIALPGWSPDWEGAAERSFFTPILDGRGYGDGSTNFGGLRQRGGQRRGGPGARDDRPARLGQAVGRHRRHDHARRAVGAGLRADPGQLRLEPAEELPVLLHRVADRHGLGVGGLSRVRRRARTSRCGPAVRTCR